MNMSHDYKYLQVKTALMREIDSGKWAPGMRLPSEATLVRQFGVSRITVGRAVKDLQLAGLIERRAGSGSFMRQPPRPQVLSFGLIIPELGETDIFEPLCQGIMASPLAHGHALLWGNGGGSPGVSKAAAAWQACRQYIERGVSGVFFAPLSTEPSSNELNRQIVAALDAADIPVVLLDRSILPYPRPSAYDLVGIDNRSAGFVVTDHLLRHGCQRIVFIGRKDGASTTDAREAGYRDALYSANAAFDRSSVHRGDATDETALRDFITASRPDGIVCANDRTAGGVMHALRRFGRQVPGDVRMVGIDDVEYAQLLPVPLTTLRQPTRQIGDVALHVMLQRIARPDLPACETRLNCELIVRESCGARSALAA
jgi:GntR family transcriptional regulator, arabinose operon transcriptional repressor